MCPGMQEQAVHFLLKHGADCKLQDNDGVAPIDTARHFPEILAAMHRQQVLATSQRLCFRHRLYISLLIHPMSLEYCTSHIVVILRSASSSFQRCHCIDKRLPLMLEQQL